jgi:8-amino-7-oxononanoate synthase
MDRIDSLLEQRAQLGLLRSLRPSVSRKPGRIHFQGKELADLSSNDYLGLSSHPALKQAAQHAIDVHGTGVCASRLLSGSLQFHHELEEKVARFKAKPSALVLNSGYQGNVGVLAALCHKGDAILCDRLSHASCLDGARLSGARVFRYQHNDIGHLRNLLEKTQGQFAQRLVVTESVFSMDGDLAPLRDIVALKDDYKFLLFVDEAHATGIFGAQGAGLVAEQDLADQVDVIMGTFSKALGSFGAYVACSAKTKTFLINTCRSLIYSTALPPGIIAANGAALDVVKAEPLRRKTLLKNATWLREQLRKTGLEAIGQSQVVPVLVGDASMALHWSQALLQAGFWALPVRPPTVPAGQSRLRISLNYDHDRQMMARLVACLGEVAGV